MKVRRLLKNSAGEEGEKAENGLPIVEGEHSIGLSGKNKLAPLILMKKKHHSWRDAMAERKKKPGKEKGTPPPPPPQGGGTQKREGVRRKKKNLSEPAL